jgi:hypothetical protein
MNDVHTEEKQMAQDICHALLGAAAAAEAHASFVDEIAALGKADVSSMRHTAANIRALVPV